LIKAENGLGHNVNETVLYLTSPQPLSFKEKGIRAE